MITCQNYKSFTGFRLNKVEYSAYPEEEEVLLSEGSTVVILDVLSKQSFPKASDAFKDYDLNQEFTIIHLLLPDKSHSHDQP